MPKTLSETTKHNLGLIAVAAFALVAIVVAVLAVSPRNIMSGPPGETAVQTSQNNVPLAGLELPLTHLEGQWYMKEDGTEFVGTVQGNDIEIQMMSNGVGALYWHGTFKTAESPGNIITSTKTESPDEIVISQSQTKDFTIGQNSITFKFSAMGFSKNIELRR